MKQVTAAIVALICIFSLAVPGWAVQYKPEWQQEIDSQLQSILSRSERPAGYDYYLTFYNDGTNQVFVYFYTDSYIPQGCILHWATVRGLEAYDKGTQREAFQQTEKITFLEYNKYWAIAYGAQMGIPIKYLITDRSTATFYNQNTVNFTTDPFIELGAAPGPAVETAELEGLLVEAKSIEDIGYTAPSWRRLEVAIDNGETVLAKEEKTQPEVDGASGELRVSMTSLTIASSGGGNGGKYLDGITMDDILPANTAIMDNINVAVYYGIVIFGVLLGIRLVQKLLKRFMGGGKGGGTFKYNKKG